MSRIRANQITNQSADGAPTVQNGLVISGVTTSTTFSGSGASLTNIPDSALSAVTASKLTGALPAISGANLTNLDASDLASGTVPTARLGSGTANSSTFLAGDSTFKTVTGTTINNNANNRVITGSGSANTLEGESTLTFTNSGSAAQLNFKRSTATDQETIFYYDSSYLDIETREATGIRLKTNKNDRLIIDSNGNVHINNSNNLKKFSVREGSTSSGVYYNAHIGGASHLANYAVGIGFDPEGYSARTKIGIVAEGISAGYSRGKLHFLLDNAHDSGEATLSEARMTINDSGQVIMPSQPSFAVGKNGNAYQLNNQVMPFDITRHNTGSHFNTGNYRFTAPVAGRYLFTFHSIIDGSINSGQQHYSIRINNSVSRGMNSHMTPATSNWDQVSSSYILELSENDYVTMYSNSNTRWHGNDWQLFCGQLIS